MIGFIISAIKIIFVLGFLVLIHEGGHFLVAKFFKVQVNEFSIGFGKELISTKKKETKYVLRMIPFGGYVSMLGEEERSSEQGSFSELPVPKRIAIVAAGGLVNIVFGIITYFVLVSIVANNFYSTKIDTTKSNYAAEISGIQEGDEIISINNKRIHLYSEVNKIVQESNGDSISVKVKRNDEVLEFDIKPTEEINKTIGIYLGTEDDASCKIEYLYPDMPAEEARN
ncbi:MAG: site-2 protease family protein [Clostridia bacterium]|nr:site-2 protease family protein [Clostridia bacterium]